MKKIFTLATLLLFLTMGLNAQMGIGINRADSSAILQVQDTTRGLLIPRMTAAQRMAISRPAEGLLVYQLDAQNGIWCFAKGIWKNLMTPNNGGIHTLILADDITDAEARLKIAQEAGPYTQEIKIMRCTKLTTVDLSMFTRLDEVFILDNTALQTVTFNKLQTVYGGIIVDGCPAFKTLSASSLKSVGRSFSGTYGVKINNSGLQALIFPLLAKVTGDVEINAPKTNAALKILSLPLLTVAPNLTVTGWPDLYLISFPSLTKLTNLGVLTIANTGVRTIQFPQLFAAGIYIEFCHELTAVSFPSLTTIFPATQVNLNITNCYNLTSISFDKIKPPLFPYFIRLNRNKLPSTQINYLLHILSGVLSPGTGKNIDLKQLTPAPPTGQGIIDLATLRSYSGVIVTTD